MPNLGLEFGLLIRHSGSCLYRNAYYTPDGYSYLSASIGSTLLARRAGM